MQPISTTRSPEAGSSPVVSVSKTISRIRSSLPRLDLSPAQSSDCAQQGPHLNRRRFMTAAGVDDEVGPSPLLRVGRLLGQYGRKFLRRHARTLQDPLLL